MFGAREDARAAGRPSPSCGTVLAVDSFVIRASARRPDLAQRVIDFIRDGENAADASNLIGAGKPNAAALP